MATIVAIGSISACGSGSRNPIASECTITIGGVEYFDGSLDCLKRLPQSPHSGYWQLGHENSVFYPERPAEIWELDRDAAWLSYSEAVEQAAQPYLDGEVHLLEVEFIGAKSERFGFYGAMPSKSGVFMERLVRAVEIKSVPLRRGEPPDTSPERTRER
jgi:hypothetical protein